MTISSVDAVITCHREGLLAHTTLLNIELVRQEAERNGVSVNFLITLDKADDETRRIVMEHPSLRDSDRVFEISVGDLSLARNYAIERAASDAIGTFDADDYFSVNWLSTCCRMATSHGPTNIFHPEVIVAFGAWQAFWWQIDQPTKFYQPEAMVMLNPWNACTFGYRSVFERHPYAPSRVGESGFGFEDWHWNAETIAHGYVHRLAWGTARFERRKKTGSLNQAHQQVSALIRPTPFFEQLAKNGGAK